MNAMIVIDERVTTSEWFAQPTLNRGKVVVAVFAGVWGRRGVYCIEIWFIEGHTGKLPRDFALPEPSLPNQRGGPSRVFALEGKQFNIPWIPTICYSRTRFMFAR